MCTSSGRKAAQDAYGVERRQPGRMVDKSKFVGGQAALYKDVSVSGATKQGLFNDAVRAEDRLGAEAGGGTIDPRRYGGTSYDTGGEANNIETSFTGKASEGVSGMNWTGASGRTYGINRLNDTQYGSGETGGEVMDVTTTWRVGKKQTAVYGVKDKWNVGAVKGGVDIGKTEDEARKVYADFGMDFDKDKYRGDFYKTERGLANQQRQNVQGKESAVRKVRRIRVGRGAADAAGGNATRKQKKQGNLRISTSGLQGGGTGGGTTLS